MEKEGLKLIPHFYTYYKFFNSLFLGLSVGSIFVLYTPLDPSIYSLGGIALALAMLLIAKLYPLIMTLRWFFRFSALVEFVILAIIIYFLAIPYTYMTALIIYIGYQITFSFGSYLVRAETLALESDTLLSRVDVAKQLGYLAGMMLSYLFYKVLEIGFSIVSKEEKVYDLHWMLLGCEFIVIFLLFKSFSQNHKESP